MKLLTTITAISDIQKQLNCLFRIFKLKTYILDGIFRCDPRFAPNAECPSPSPGAPVEIRWSLRWTRGSASATSFANGPSQPNCFEEMAVFTHFVSLRYAPLPGPSNTMQGARITYFTNNLAEEGIGRNGSFRRDSWRDSWRHWEKDQNDSQGCRIGAVLTRDRSVLRQRLQGFNPAFGGENRPHSWELPFGYNPPQGWRNQGFV